MMSFPVRIVLALAALSLFSPLPSSAQELEKVPLSVMELISGGEQVGMKLEEYENSLLQRPDGKPSERRTFPPALFMLEYLLSRHLPGEWKGPLYPDRGRDFWEKRDFPVLEKAPEAMETIAEWKEERKGASVLVEVVYDSAGGPVRSLLDLSGVLQDRLNKKGAAGEFFYVRLCGGGFFAVSGVGADYLEIIPSFGEKRRIRTSLFSNTPVSYILGISRISSETGE